MNVVVIGAGVVGLSSAIRLREAGCRVTIVAEHFTPDTTSDRAGAVFTPFTSSEHRSRVVESLHTFQDLARTHPQSGVRVALVREYCPHALEKLPPWTEAVSGIRRIDRERLSRAAYADGFEAELPHMSMLRYMPWLMDQCREMDVEMKPGRVTGISQIDHSYDVIVNCTGLGARTLAPDTSVLPMRGQVVRVKNTIGLNHSIVVHDDVRVTYIFAFPDYVVLGGTYERDACEAETDEATLAAIVDRCRTLLRADGHADWSRLAEHRLASVVGLRPARIVGEHDEAARCEADADSTGRVVLHNYGHGRSGVTMSWGCAAEIARMATQLKNSGASAGCGTNSC